MSQRFERRLLTILEIISPRLLVDHPTLDGMDFSSILEVDGGGMVVPFSEEEIRRVVLESDGAKSLDPDGFNFSFYKRF